jgi:hypothetical protein
LQNRPWQLQIRIPRLQKSKLQSAKLNFANAFPEIADEIGIFAAATEGLISRH